MSLHAFILRMIASACLRVAWDAASGTSRERQGYYASMMLEYRAVELEAEEIAA